MIPQLDVYIPNDYIRAFVIGAVLLLVLRVGVSLFWRGTIALTKKTKSDFDDLLIQRTSKPITIILFFFSVIIALNELRLRPSFDIWATRSIWTGIVIVSGYFIYVLFDVLILSGWQKFSERSRGRVDNSLVSLIQGILQAALVVLSILYILDLWGVQIGPLLAGLGIAGVAVALALQPTLSNIIAGAAIVFDKSIRIGDVIYLDNETRGRIEKIGIRSTKIRTPDNEFIIIPNNKLAESRIQNVSLPEPKTRVQIPFNIAMGSNIEKVKSIIVKELKAIKKISKEPEPYVHLVEVSGVLKFRAYFYVDHINDKPELVDEANTRIYNILKSKVELK